jgi:hypothetical protein
MAIDYIKIYETLGGKKRTEIKSIFPLSERKHSAI